METILDFNHLASVLNSENTNSPRGKGRKKRRKIEKQNWTHHRLARVPTFLQVKVVPFRSQNHLPFVSLMWFLLLVREPYPDRRRPVTTQTLLTLAITLRISKSNRTSVENGVNVADIAVANLQYFAMETGRSKLVPLWHCLILTLKEINEPDEIVTFL